MGLRNWYRNYMQCAREMAEPPPTKDPHPETSRVLQDIMARLDEATARVKEQPDPERKRAIARRVLTDIAKMLDELEAKNP